MNSKPCSRTNESAAAARKPAVVAPCIDLKFQTLVTQRDELARAAWIYGQPARGPLGI